MSRVSMVDGHIDEPRIEKPEFMEHIQLSAPKIADMGEFKIGMEINTLIQTVENFDDALCEEIIKMAKEKGINDLWLLNKNAIVSALESQIPKKAINRVDLYPPNQHECPVCKCGLRVSNKWKDNYCCNCGQALDWSDTKCQ